jgi:PAS domain S-box-containing protein
MHSFARSSDGLVSSTLVEVPAELFRLLVESVQDYAIYLLDPNGTIQSWNAGAQRLKGYTAAEIVGQSFAAFFTAEARAADKPAWLLARAREDGRVEDVGWRVRKDGSQFWASAVMTALRDPAGNLVGFAKVTRDLTDRSYRAFIEASHSIVWTTDGAGRASADSPTWREFTGQSEAEWRGHQAYDPVHPDDVGALRDAWTSAKATATRLEAEFRLRRADGQYVWMHASAVPFLDRDGHVREWFGVTSDISARKLAELETERALQLWHTTLRSIGDAVISTDAAGRVRFMNPVAERLTGWTPTDAAGQPLREVFPIFNEETGAVVENPVEKVLREGIIVGLANHTVLRQRSGFEVPIDDSAAPIHGPSGDIEGVVLVFRDASEEKRELLRRGFLSEATQRLLEATDYKDTLAQIAQLAVPRLADWVGVDLADDSTGKTHHVAVAHVDPTKVEFARELGERYPADPNAPTGVSNVIRTGRSEFYPQIPKAMLERAAVDAEHLRMIRELDLRSAMIVPLPGRTRVLGAITFIYAQSDRRYSAHDLEFAEELARRAGLIIERRRLEEEADYANRMKDEFLATMSHELRTPLQAILGYSSMLRRGVAREPDKALDAIERNAGAQARLVEDILDVSRIVSGKLRLSMSRVDIAGAVRAALESIGPAAEARRIRVSFDLPEELGTIRGDADRIQQITWNLLSNAIKFTPPGGTVEVRAERTGSSVRIAVRDTGKGIPREHISTIFERFRQLDSSTTRQHGGLGLGLAIVRYLVEAHGGTVAAESEGPGKGATFVVTLPAQVDAVTRPERAAASAASTERPLLGINVLIVDDDDDARTLLAEVLGSAGATVTSAVSAGEAFALVQAQPTQILISDIGMPDEDGYSLLRRVRALPPDRGGNVHAIALTAFARPEDTRNARDAGFQQHIVKPVGPEALVEALAAWAKRT